jgi:hypothetical protein
MVGAAILVSGIAVTTFGTEDSSAGPRPQPISGGWFEASGVVPVQDGRQFLFVADDYPSELFLIEVDGTRQRGDPVRIPLDAHITDPEAMTWDGRYYYVVGSQSKPTGFDGDGLIRFTYDATRRRVSHVERILALKKWLADNVVELRGADRQPGDHILNIEGLAWDPAGRLLLGLRAPVIGGHALVVPLSLAHSRDRSREKTCALQVKVFDCRLAAPGFAALNLTSQSESSASSPVPP